MQKSMQKQQIENLIRIDEAWLLSFSGAYAEAMVQSAPDLGSKNLAARYSLALFRQLAGSSDAPLSKEKLLDKGNELFFELGKNLYGPLAVAFADSLLKKVDKDTILMFPQRDANIFYVAALALKSEKPEAYAIPIAF